MPVSLSLSVDWLLVHGVTLIFREWSSIGLSLLQDISESWEPAKSKPSPSLAVAPRPCPHHQKPRDQTNFLPAPCSTHARSSAKWIDRQIQEDGMGLKIGYTYRQICRRGELGYDHQQMKHRQSTSSIHRGLMDGPMWLVDRPGHFPFEDLGFLRQVFDWRWRVLLDMSIPAFFASICGQCQAPDNAEYHFGDVVKLSEPDSSSPRHSFCSVTWKSCNFKSVATSLKLKSCRDACRRYMRWSQPLISSVSVFISVGGCVGNHFLVARF